MIDTVTAPDFSEVHPLIDAKMRFGVKRIAEELGHANHSTVAVYMARAAKDPDAKVPPEWVRTLCRMTRRDPHAFRPDLFETEWRYSESS